jgi:hypothetical protein
MLRVYLRCVYLSVVETGGRSITAAALLLVRSAMLRNLSFGGELRACAIAASFAEYGILF